MDISQLKLPTWLPNIAKRLMGLAEELYGPGTGATKKAWVRAALLDAAKVIDIPEIPNFIENPAKAVLIDFIIEVVWSLHFQEPNFAPLARVVRLPAA
jgi:hypothetical protein